MTTTSCSASVVKIGDLPEGTPLYNIESNPGDGGKFVRSAGSFGYISAHIGDTDNSHTAIKGNNNA